MKEMKYSLVNYYSFLSSYDIIVQNGIKICHFDKLDGIYHSIWWSIHACRRKRLNDGMKGRWDSIPRSINGNLFWPCPFGFKPRLVPARINFLQRLLLVVDLANLFVWTFGRINIEPLQRDRAEAVKPIKVSVTLCGIVLLSFHSDLSMQHVIKLEYSTVLQTIVVTWKVIL